MSELNLHSTGDWTWAGVVGLLLAFLLGGSPPALAQSENAPRYTMMFRGVSLETALGSLADETQASLVYDSELVEGERVYCSARDATEEALLRCLLSDTPIDFYQASSGTYVLTASPRRAPSKGNLTGVVIDSRTGEPLPHAHVLLAAANTGVATDRAGRFRLPDLQSGTHRVVTTHLGYKPTVDSIQVPPGDSVRHRIALTPTPIVSEPVVVDGVQRRVPEGGLGSHTLESAELRETSHMGTPDALSRTGSLLGVQLQRPLADLHVQGGAAGEHEVHLDGMPIRNPVTMRRLMGAFSPLALDRLTVHKAGFGVEQGSTVSGVLSAEHALSSSSPAYGQVTIDPMSVNAEAHGTVALDDYRNAQVRIAGRSSVWDVYQDPTLNRLLLDWNVADPMLLASYFDQSESLPVEPAAQTAAVNFSDLHGATRVDLGPFQSLFVSGYWGQNQFQTEFVATEPTDPTSSGTSTMLTQDEYAWENGAGQARLDWALGARGSASIQLRASQHTVRRGYQMSYAHAETSPEESNAVIDTLRRTLSPERWPDDYNRIREVGLETTGSYTPSSRHQLEASVEATRLSSRFDLGQRFFRPTAFRDTRWQFGGYLRDVISLRANTTLSAGTRFTYIPVRRTLYAEPRLDFHHDGTTSGLGDYALRLAGGLYRQFVNRFDVSSTSPTATLPSMRFWLPVGRAHAPPRAYHAVAEVQTQPSDPWTVTAEGFYKHYPRLLALDYAAFQGDTNDPVPPSSAIAPARGYATGGGLALSRNGSTVESTLRYDWIRSRRQFPSRFNDRLVPTPWNQPHQLSLSTDVAVTDALNAHLQGEVAWGRSWGYRQTYYDYFSEVSEDLDLGLSLQDPSAHRLAPSTRLDLGSSYSLRWGGLSLETRLEVVNLLDRQNPFDWGLQPTEDGATPTTRRLPGRRLVGSLTIRY